MGGDKSVLLVHRLGQDSTLGSPPRGVEPRGVTRIRRPGGDVAVAFPHGSARALSLCRSLLEYPAQRLLFLRRTANSGSPTRPHKGNQFKCLQHRSPLPAVREIPRPSASLRPPPLGSSPSPSHHKRPLPSSKSRHLSPSPLRGIFHIFSPHPLPLQSRLFVKTATHTL